MTIITLNDELLEQQLVSKTLIETIKSVGADPETRNSILSKLASLESVILTLSEALLNMAQSVSLTVPKMANCHDRRLWKSNRRRAQAMLQRGKNLDGLRWYKSSYSYSEHMDVVAECSRVQMKNHQHVLKTLNPLRCLGSKFEGMYRLIYDHAIKEGLRPLAGTTSHKMSMEFLDDGVFVTLPAPSAEDPNAAFLKAHNTHGGTDGPWFPPLRRIPGVDLRFRPKHLTNEEHLSANKKLAEFMEATCPSLTQGLANDPKPVKRLNAAKKAG